MKINVMKNAWPVAILLASLLNVSCSSGSGEVQSAVVEQGTLSQQTELDPGASTSLNESAVFSDELFPNTPPQELEDNSAQSVGSASDQVDAAQSIPTNTEIGEVENLEINNVDVEGVNNEDVNNEDVNNEDVNNEEANDVDVNNAENTPVDELVQPFEVTATAIPLNYPRPETRLQVEQIALDESQMSYLEKRDELGGETVLTRITSNDAFQSSNGDAVHFYSKRQAWNSDQTMLDVGNKIISAIDYSILVDSVLLSSARNWSNRNPNLMYGITSNPDVNEFSKFDVMTGEVTPLFIFGGMRNCSLGQYEGNITLDDRLVAIVCTRTANDKKSIIAFNIESNKITATIDAEPNLNWASFSPSGDYLLVENNHYPDDRATLVVYEPNLTNARYIGEPNHGDIGFDSEGNEVYAIIGGVSIRYIRLSDGVQTTLPVTNSELPLGFGHLSCRNHIRRGWCYFSSGRTNWVGAVLLSQSESRVEHWGYHRSTKSSYSAVPKATVSRDGTQILFSSDWFGRSEINDYILESPQVEER